MAPANAEAICISDCGKFLTAAARASAAHASVAASITNHDGTAGVAAGGVAHVVEVFHGVGYVDGRGLGSRLGGWLTDGAGSGEVADDSFDGDAGEGGGGGGGS